MSFLMKENGRGCSDDGVGEVVLAACTPWGSDGISALIHTHLPIPASMEGWISAPEGVHADCVAQ